MAKRLETNQSTLSHYEAGHRMPDGAFLARLQVAFGVNVNWLLCGRGHWQLEQYDRPGQDAGPVLHPDDQLLLDHVKRRLQQKHEPSMLSAAVVITSHDGVNRRPGSPWGKSLRALPYTSDMAAVGTNPLPEDKIEGVFVITHDPRQPPENIRCLHLRGDQFAPSFCRGSVLGIDISRQDPDDLDGKVVLVHLELDDGRNLLRLKRDKEFLLFAHVSQSPHEAVRIVEVDKVERYSIIGQVVWAWHEVT